MRNLTYTLSPHPRSLRSLTPKRGGKKGAHGLVVQVNPRPESLFEDVDATFVLSGSTEEPDNTNGSKSNHQHKRGFWRQVEMRNLTYTLSPHSRSLYHRPPKGGKGRAPHGP